MRRSALIAFSVLALALPFGLVACGGGEEVTATPETIEGEPPAATTAPETNEAPTSTVEGDAAAGDQIYASSGCGGCHALEAAGSSGNVGPNLDESKPDAALTINRVTNGQGAMPSFKEQLSEKQIADVTAYVVASTSG